MQPLELTKKGKCGIIKDYFFKFDIV